MRPLKSCFAPLCPTSSSAIPVCHSVPIPFVFFRLRDLTCGSDSTMSFLPLHHESWVRDQGGAEHLQLGHGHGALPSLTGNGGGAELGLARRFIHGLGSQDVGVLGSARRRRRATAAALHRHSSRGFPRGGVGHCRRSSCCDSPRGGHARGAEPGGVLRRPQARRARASSGRWPTGRRSLRRLQLQRLRHPRRPRARWSARARALVAPPGRSARRARWTAASGSSPGCTSKSTSTRSGKFTDPLRLVRSSDPVRRRRRARPAGLSAHVWSWHTGFCPPVPLFQGERCWTSTPGWARRGRTACGGTGSSAAATPATSSNGRNKASPGPRDRMIACSAMNVGIAGQCCATVCFAEIN